MIFAQWIFDQLLQNLTRKKRTLALNWQREFLKGIRRQFLRCRDPIVQWRLGKKPLWINLSHELPFLLTTHPNYNANLPRIAWKVKEKYPEMKCIDVGANIGDTVALLREATPFPILCIDGEQRFIEILQKNIAFFPDVFIENTFLGEETGTKILNVRVEKGTAHLESIDTNQNRIYLQTLDHVLEHWPDFITAKLIKIDTDGFDGNVIRGAKQFLSRSQPVIFLEYDPYLLEKQGDNGLLLLEELRKIGYAYVLIYENVGDFMISVNLDEKRTLEEIHLYFSARNGRKYCDICLFHKNDEDLFENCRRTEPFYYPPRRL